jgi:hypothetical protein
MAAITISQGLGIQKTLEKRHAELVSLRNENANRVRSYIGANADKEITKEPMYDVKALDKMITRLAREQRLLDEGIKQANATLAIPNYEWNDEVLGELS